MSTPSENVNIATASEMELREAKVIWPKSETELLGYIQTLLEREHDYGTCVYAASMAATATFHYVAHVLGMTGFQASCADLDIIRRTRLLTGPFALVKAEDLLYPQYDVPTKVQGYIDEWREWTAEQAREKIAEHGGENGVTEWTDDDGVTHSRPTIAPRVWEHWTRLAADPS